MRLDEFFCLQSLRPYQLFRSDVAFRTQREINLNNLMNGAHIFLVFIICFSSRLFLLVSIFLLKAVFKIIHFHSLRNFGSFILTLFCLNEVNSVVFIVYSSSCFLAFCRAANLSQVAIPIRLNQYCCACMRASAYFAWCQSQSDRKLQQQQQQRRRQRRTADLIVATTLLEGLGQVKYRSVPSSERNL